MTSWLSSCMSAKQIFIRFSDSNLHPHYWIRILYLLVHSVWMILRISLVQKPQAQKVSEDGYSWHSQTGMQMILAHFTTLVRVSACVTLCNVVTSPSLPCVSWPCRLRQCDDVLGGVIRVQWTQACNGHWRWVAMLLSQRATIQQSMVFK